MIDASDRIMLFFTTANPPTGSRGQKGLVARFLKDCEQLQVIPLNQSAKSRSLAGYQHRVNMARLAFEDLDSKVLVTEEARDVESAALLPLISKIKSVNASKSLSLVMGSDAFEVFLDEVAQAGEVETEGEGPSLSSLLTAIKVVPRAGHPEPPEMTELNGVLVEKVDVPSLARTSSSVLADSIDPQFLINNSDHHVLRYMERKRLYSFSNGLMQTKPAVPLPRNPTLDSTAALMQQTAAQRPQHLLSDASPLLAAALCEMLKRKVTDKPCEWLAQYLRLNKNSALEEAGATQEKSQTPGELGKSIEGEAFL